MTKHVQDMLNDPDKAKCFKKNFIAAFKSDGDGYKFADKAMYGSDWHMPHMIGHTAKFLDFFIELFNDPVLRPHKEKFFYRNALRFLKLEDFVARHKTTQPGLFSADTLAAFEEKTRLSKA